MRSIETLLRPSARFGKGVDSILTGEAGSMESINFQVRWLSVTDSEGSPYQYPAKLSRFLQEKYEGPAIYRWRVLPVGADGKETIYIGQAEDLAQRAQRVLTPGNQRKGDPTNRRLRTFFREVVSNGGKVVLEVADFEAFDINGIEFSTRVLCDRFRRVAIENVILALEHAAGHNLLNKVEDLKRKQFMKRLRKMPARQRSELLEKLAPDLNKIGLIMEAAENLSAEEAVGRLRGGNPSAKAVSAKDSSAG